MMKFFSVVMVRVLFFLGHGDMEWQARRLGFTWRGDDTYEQGLMRWMGLAGDGRRTV